ncbi:SAM-dependent methyltransferase [Brumimicrobium salinarum]|uniref:SAM-dependent methyltransferase n=1 Tax=Brumimicrobium salinarum TaxID=2058658 RepID=A0A2I0R4D6_9FLAO|nr:tRNA (5-methylaminomethyl-2-thiouridine)(34)-methyltransferase MnmD [Brumimicrobium salinarum]PKR81428.1 SAM-dependent methyltransferase [Brumimicrobium salinarum]
MKREIIATKDGSNTIHLPSLNESYHSTHGAIQEAKHVFLKSGLDQVKKDQCSILEIGFGTGLNAILTYISANKKRISINYTGLEAFPVSTKELKSLAYSKIEEIKNYKNQYEALHQTSWDESHEISSFFNLEKKHRDLKDFSPRESTYNLIYFDAFGPRVQPEMWSLENLTKMYKSLKKEGIFVTYCAKGEVRRNLMKVGFNVEKIPGPPGKREMLRGVK